MRALHIQQEVQVQSATLLSLVHAKHRVSATKYAALRLGIAAKGVLAWVLAAIAFRAVWTHPETKNNGEDDTAVNGECVDGAEGVPGHYDAVQVVFWKLNCLRFLSPQTRLILPNPSALVPRTW